MIHKFISYSLLTACTILTLSCKEKPRSHDLTTANERDFLDKNLNFEKLVKIAIRGIDFRNNEKKKFLAGFRKESNKSKGLLINKIADSQVKYIKFVNTTRPALLYRMLSSDDTFGYIEFHLSKKLDNKWEIVDFYFYATGKSQSEVLRDFIAKGIGKNTQNTIHLEALQKVQKAQKAFHAAKYDEAWKAWANINPKAHTDRVITILGYSIALQQYMNAPLDSEAESNASKNILQIYETIKQNFPNDPGFAILELAIHEINKDSTQYLEAIDTIRSIVGEDPFLDLQESGADIIDKNYSAAINKIQNFIQLEPTLDYAYYLMWDICLVDKDYETLAKNFDKFDAIFGLNHEVLQEEEAYAPFFESEVGKNWLKSKQ